MTFEAMMRDIVDYIKGLPASSCKIIIGSDSQVKSDTCFITAVIVHRLGKGARYYYRKKIHRKIISLRQKIFYETALSLEVGGMVHRYFAVEGLDDLDVEIHIDVGVHGEVAGTAEIKPGQKVQKSGRTTGLTSGKVKSVGTTLQVEMKNDEKVWFSDQVVAEMASQPGDSGALILNPERKAVGLLFAGSDKLTVFNRIGTVLDRLGVEL
jgi:predicted RNase H-related nuclease YkuK (DUF458 family)